MTRTTAPPGPGTEPKKESLKRSTMHSVVGAAASKVVTIASFVVLARLLPPEDFGLLAMITVISGFFSVLLEVGFGQALIHFRAVSDRLYATAFFVTVALGTAVAGMVYLSAGWIAAFYSEPALIGLVKLLSVIFVLNSVTIIQVAFLQKQRAFRAISIAEVSAVIVGALVAFWLAASGAGAWALAWHLVAIAICRAIFVTLATPRRPKLLFGWEDVKRLWSYGKYILLTNAFNYAVLNMDQLVIGRAFGPALLGAYRYAGQLVGIPQNFVARTLNVVLLSWYSEIQSDCAAIKQAHLRIIKVLAFFAAPLMLLGVALADVLVLSVLGDKWEALIVVIRFISIIELMQTIGTVNGPLFLAQGRTRELFYVNLLRLNVLLGVFIGLAFGLEGVLWGILLARLVNFYPAIRLAGRHIGMRFADVMRHVSITLCVSAATAGALLLAKRLFDLDSRSITVLVALCAAGAGLYAILSWIFNRAAMLDSFKMIAPRFGR